MRTRRSDDLAWRQHATSGCPCTEFSGSSQKNTRRPLRIGCLYMNCQHHKPTRNLEVPPTIEPFLLLSFLPGGRPHRGLLFSPLASPPFPSLFHGLFHVPFSRIFSHCERTPQSHAILEIMSDAIENTTGSADSNDKTKLIGRESDVVPGRFGEPLQITHVQYSRGGGNTAPKRPLFLCLHGWGSNETDLADMMRYIAPYNDFASLRAPLTLQPAGRFAPGAYSWLHDCVDTGEDLDRDAFAAAKAIDDRFRRTFPTTVPWCRSVFRRAVCWRFTCCACTRNATRRRFRCPVFLRPALLREPRRRTIAWLNSTFRRSSAMARTIP